MCWPSVTILSSSGLRIPSRGSSGRDRGVLRPAWDGGAAKEPSDRGPMSRPAKYTHNGIQKHLKEGTSPCFEHHQKPCLSNRIELNFPVVYEGNPWPSNTLDEMVFWKSWKKMEGVSDTSITYRHYHMHSEIVISWAIISRVARVIENIQTDRCHRLV